MRPAIFIITGPSGAGKTTLCRMLKRERMQGIAVHDLDEFPFRKGMSFFRFREQATNHWFRRAADYSRDGKATVICGLLYPEEVLSSRYAKDFKIFYGCLRLSDQEMLLRLRRRKWKQSWLKENLVIKRKVAAQAIREKRHYFVSSGRNTPHRVAFLVKRWIRKSVKSLCF